MSNDVVLLTGFEPFGGETINPAWEVAQQLDGALIDALPGGVRVVSRQLPCCFGASREVLQQAIAELRPVGVLSLGQAQGRVDFSLERVAINIDDARIPDNAGAQPIDTPVVPGGPAAYFSTLPVKAIVTGLRAAGLPASVSLSAGTFVCNHIFYALMHELRHQPEVRAGFMHLPLLPEQAARLPGQASLPLVVQVEGVREALRIALTHAGSDAKQTEGRLD